MNLATTYQALSIFGWAVGDMLPIVFGSLITQDALVILGLPVVGTEPIPVEQGFGIGFAIEIGIAI